jgi:hypothetical protein
MKAEAEQRRERAHSVPQLHLLLPIGDLLVKEGVETREKRSTEKEEADEDASGSREHPFGKNCRRD